LTGWLVAWLWQGTVLALGVSAALKLLPRVNASTRYLIWWCASAVLVWLGWSTSPYIATLLTISSDTIATQASSPSLFEVTPFPQWLITFIFATWVAVASFKLLKILPGLHALYRLKASSGPVLETIEMRLPVWLEQKRIGRPAQLMICNGLSNAAVLGLRHPYIAFPARLLNIVSADELDQILLHEYAHVQRRDDWTRLAHALLDATLWMHPAARWISAELNLEREVACDDWVVSKTRAAVAYAGCLSRVAEHHQAQTAASLVPALFTRSPDVVRRVERLLNPKRNATRKLSFAAASVGICVMTASAAHLRALPLIGEVSAALVAPEAPALIRTALSALRAPSTPQVVPEAAATKSMRQTASPDLVMTIATATAPPVVTALPIVDARSFPAIDTPPIVPTRVLAQTSASGWRFGATIGQATRKAGAAVGGSMTKAGTSIAKSF
jgi:beta-lactamase regulating signal transducer with metallopeptidase domain